MCCLPGSVCLQPALVSFLEKSAPNYRLKGEKPQACNTFPPDRRFFSRRELWQESKKPSTVSPFDGERFRQNSAQLPLAQAEPAQARILQSPFAQTLQYQIIYQ